MKDSHIVIVIEHGVVTVVLSDRDLTYTVVDYDVDGSVDTTTTTGIVAIPQSGLDGDTFPSIPAWASEHCAYVDPARIREITEAVQQSYET